jgi:hypothetical protein
VYSHQLVVGFGGIQWVIFLQKEGL